jgi:hypothetical protein
MYLGQATDDLNAAGVPNSSPWPWGRPAFKIGDKIKHTMSENYGVVAAINDGAGTYVIDWVDGTLKGRDPSVSENDVVPDQRELVELGPPAAPSMGWSTEKKIGAVAGAVAVVAGLWYALRGRKRNPRRRAARGRR